MESIQKRDPKHLTPLEQAMLANKEAVPPESDESKASQISEINGEIRRLRAMPDYDNMIADKIRDLENKRSLLENQFRR